MRAFGVLLERGTKRVFASALDWPGWSRSGRDADGALEALASYGPRYRRAMGAPARPIPADVPASLFEVLDRVQGNATTDFGAPGAVGKADGRPLDGRELQRQLRLLRAAWRAFDRSAASASGIELAKGPRGGGRSVDAMVRHVHDAEAAYLSKIGGPTKAPAHDAELRALYTRILTARAMGEPPPRVPRSGSVWPVRYAIRRSAWHALDHAWEIEDRSSA